jgi:hypothetical protein
MAMDGKNPSRLMKTQWESGFLVVAVTPRGCLKKGATAHRYQMLNPKPQGVGSSLPCAPIFGERNKIIGKGIVNPMVLIKRRKIK